MRKETINYYSQTRPEVAAFVPIITKSIIDIGCSDGDFLQFVKKQTGAETWGIESVPEIAEEARNKIDHILIGKIEELISSLPDGYFDCISFNDVLEHLIEPTEVLKMMRHKLSENGVVIASIPNVRYFFNLRDLLIYRDWHYIGNGILDSTHLRFFTRKSMKRMFEDAGYKITSQVGINKIVSWKFQLLYFLTLGILGDTKYLQFVCVAKSNKSV
ncbi:MAG: class I SAM-dependent methyltransferase [Mariniphaga sp.]